MKDLQKLLWEEILNLGKKNFFFKQKNGRKNEEEADINGRSMSYRHGEEAQDVSQ